MCTGGRGLWCVNTTEVLAVGAMAAFWAGALGTFVILRARRRRHAKQE
jgi:hypothetical protein